MSSVIAVIGATGGVGSEAVKQLLASGQEVRAIVRDPERARRKLGSNDHLQIVKADVEDLESLRIALKGVSGVINACAGSSYWSANGVDCRGSGNVAQAASEVGAHVVLISSCFVTRQHRFHLGWMFLNTVRWGMMDAKLKGEDLLRQSGAAYTIIRPGHLINGPAGKRILMSGQGDKGKPGCVSRADVAAVAILALISPAASNRKTIELSSQPDHALKDDVPQQDPFLGTLQDA